MLIYLIRYQLRVLSAINSPTHNREPTHTTTRLRLEDYGTVLSNNISL